MKALYYDGTGYRPDFRGIMGHEFVGEVVESDDKSLIVHVDMCREV